MLIWLMLSSTERLIVSIYLIGLYFILRFWPPVVILIDSCFAAWRFFLPCDASSETQTLVWICIYAYAWRRLSSLLCVLFGSRVPKYVTKQFVCQAFVFERSEIPRFLIKLILLYSRCRWGSVLAATIPYSFLLSFKHLFIKTKKFPVEIHPL